MQTRTLIVAISLPLLTALACKAETPAPEASAERPAVVATLGAEGVEGSERVAVEGGTPKIAADEAEFDFGGIGAQDTASHVFTIKNLGDGDLKIDRVQKT